MKGQENNKRKSRIFSFIRLLIIIIITIVITYVVTVRVTINTYLSKGNSAYMSAKLSLIKNKLEETYIYDIKEENMIESAIKGYVAGLGDKYTQYMTEEDMSSLYESTTGSFVGVGVYMVNNTTNNTVTIVGVIEDSAAEKAGLMEGDIIAKVDDVEYTGNQLDDVSAAIKGEEGTNVKITIIRDGAEIEYNIRRASVKIKSVSGEMLDGNIAYIKISSFDEGTSNEFKDKYKELANKNPKGLIIDLRNNGGGLVTESLKIADTMVEKGNTLLITRDKNKKEKVDKATSSKLINIPVVILINGNTASASEILAGALRDNCNYKIMGTNSYGKGVIQSVYTFSDGTGIKVTMQEYFSPKHNVINGVGIAPDEEVLQESGWEYVTNVPFENDIQLQKAMEEF